MLILSINSVIFINMAITEEEKREILSKYDGKTSDDLLNHLKRAFPVQIHTLNWTNLPLKSIEIDGKIRFLEKNKKYLVNRLTDLLKDSWKHLENDVFRRTIKKYIDGIGL